MNHFKILLIYTLIFSVLAVGCKQSDKVVEESIVLTINGPINPHNIGLTLIHEHVFLDWSKADSIDKSAWNEDEAFEVIIPYLEEMKENGVQTFLECTPAYLGRNPLLLKKLSDSTGLQILTNTGFYAARDSQHIPAFAFEASASEIAKIWIGEFENGIDGTGIKPGFIKIGMDSKAPLTKMDEKLVRAAAKTHLTTGLTIVAHTGTDTTAAQELAILEEEGVAPDAFVWTHAQRGTKQGHIKLAKRGAWVSLDGMGWIRPDTATKDSSSLYQYMDYIENLKSNNLLHRTLISHDAGWYTVGEKDQSGYKPYTPIFDLVIPMLKKRGFTQEDIDTLLIKNPQEAYSLKTKPFGGEM